MAKRTNEDKRMERTNKREYKRWMAWRAIIDPKTAAWIMQDPGMRHFIDLYRYVGIPRLTRRAEEWENC